MSKKQKEKKKCLTPGCDQVEQNRGLCSTHRTIASKLVSDGKTTYEALVRAGKINAGPAPRVKLDPTAKAEAEAFFLN